MFKIMKIGSQRLDIELSGKLSSEEMQIALDELESELFSDSVVLKVGCLDDPGVFKSTMNE